MKPALLLAAALLLGGTPFRAYADKNVPPADTVKSHDQYVGAIRGLGANPGRPAVAYPAGDAFTFHKENEEGEVSPPITWQNFERANVERVAQLRAYRPGEFRVYLGRDASAAFAADVFLGGGDEATLVNIGRVNRDKPGIAEYIDRTIVKAAKGRPIVIIDTSASGETYQDFILPHIPQAMRSKVTLDLGLQMLSRSERAAPLPNAAQSYAFLHYLTPEREQILLPKRKGTYQKVEKDFPHAVARSRAFAEVPGIGMDAVVKTSGSNSPGTEDGSVDYEKNMTVMAAMAQRLSSSQVRKDVDHKVALLRELYEFAYEGQNAALVLRRIAYLQAMFEGESLRGMQAHFRDVVDRLEVDPRFRGTRTGVLFSNDALKEVGLQAPFKPGRPESTPRNLETSDLERIFFSPKSTHAGAAQKSFLRLLLEKWGKSTSSLPFFLRALAEGGEVAAEVRTHLKDWPFATVNEHVAAEKALNDCMERGDTASAKALYTLLYRNSAQADSSFPKVKGELAQTEAGAAIIRTADVSPNVYPVSWHDGRALSGISPDELLSEIKAEVATAIDPKQKGVGANVAARRAAYLLQLWSRNKRIKPFRASDVIALLEMANHEIFFFENSFPSDALRLATEIKIAAPQHGDAVRMLTAAAALLNHADMEFLDPHGAVRSSVAAALKPELAYRLKFSPEPLKLALGVAVTAVCNFAGLIP